MSTTQDRLQEVFREVFDDDAITLRPEMTAQDVDGWDSLMHVTLIVHVEQEFGVRFTSREVAGLQCIGDLVSTIDARLAG